VWVGVGGDGRAGPRGRGGWDEAEDEAVVINSGSGYDVGKW
jgi:hypothetical protein